MSSFFSQCPSLKTVLTLQAADHLFINEVQRSFNEADFLERLKGSCDLGFMIRISEASSLFCSICKRIPYRSLWNNQWEVLASAFAQLYQTSVSFYIMPEVFNVFDLLKGEFFFLQAEKVRIAFNNASVIGYSEGEFLQKAIAYHSIHAIQRYNQYLYKEGKFIEAILQSKNVSVLKIHGSYAYMVLAEAYFQYANYLAANGDDKNKISNSIQAVREACTEAERHLPLSVGAIHNASFGKGLAASNSLGISHPAEVHSLLDGWLENDKGGHNDLHAAHLSLPP